MVNKKDFSTWIKNMDCDVQRRIDDLEHCFTLQEVEEKFIKPLLRTGALPETLAVKEGFYMKVKEIANLKESASTLWRHIGDCIKEVKNEKKLPEAIKLSNNTPGTYLIEIQCENEQYVEELIGRIRAEGKVEIKLLGKYGTRHVSLGNDIVGMFPTSSLFPLPRLYTIHHYTLLLTGSPADVEAAAVLFGYHNK